MKFSCEALKFLSASHMRVLAAVEVGSKNHEAVPVQLISHVSNVSCNMQSVLLDLLKQNFIKRVYDIHYEGYVLTHTGYDNLALHALVKKKALASIGMRVGVGKESDVYLARSCEGRNVVVKIHRLGRTSFRTVKKNRNYLENRKHASWLYLSRLSAAREYSHMVMLKDSGVPIPRPVDTSRHIVVMEYLGSYVPLYQVVKLDNPEFVCGLMMDAVDKLHALGYAHGDFNEFNTMIRKDGKKIKVIDFPQMLRLEEEGGEESYRRDVENVERFFGKMR